jgi:hypothetical protein
VSLPDVVIRWRGGEGAIGRARAVERAAAQLGPRLGWLLQAIAALDGGSRAEVARVAAGARADGQADVAEVLELLLAPRAEIDPTTVRKQAKARGLGASGGVPVLDLLRSLAVFRTGTESPPAPALRQAARTRPALAMVMELLTSRSDRVSRDPTLEAYLLRGAQVIAVARMFRVYRQVDPAFLASNYDQDLLGLDSPRWSDLRAAGQGGGEAVARRLRGEEPWTDGHDRVAEWLYRQPDRKLWLGPMLQAIADLTSAGRLDRALGMAHVAAHLAAHAALSDPALRDLARQLVGLELRLRWALGGSDDPDVALALWNTRALAPAEQLRLAEQLLQGPVLEGPDAMEVAAVVAARSQNLDAVRDAVFALAEDRGASAAVRHQGPDPGRAALVEAWLDAMHRPERAILAIPALVAGGQGAGAARVAQDLDLDRPVPGLAEAACALAGVGVGALAALARLVGALGTVPDAVRTAAEQGLASPGADVVGAALALLAAGGQAERATSRIREEGRALRQMPAAAADERAATVVAAALTHGEHAVGQVRPLVEPLARFVLREGPERALKAARAVPASLWPGLVTLFLQLRDDLQAHEGWLDFVAEAAGPPVPDELAPLLRRASRQIVVEALKRRPATFGELEEGMAEEALSTMTTMGPDLFRAALDDLF